jgi:hypothetical protein
MLHHLVGLLLRALNAQVTGAKPLQVHAAHDPPVIDPRNTMRQWEIRLDPAHLRLAQQPQLGHQQHLLGAAIELIDCRQRK